MPVSEKPLRPRLLAIVGPTAVGKTDLAMRVSTCSDVEVIGADSRQVYRHMDIGTAKPTRTQLSAVPHHMVDIIYPNDDFSLGKFLYLSKELILNTNTAGKCPLLVGGAGQYVMGLLDNWNVPVVPPNPDLRAELECQLETDGIDSLLARLRNLDVRALERVDSANPRRVMRAIEVAVAGGSAQDSRSKLDPWFDFAVIGLGMERGALYDRADNRVDRMMEDGFIQEVEGLLAMGYGADLTSMSGIGYHELADHLLNGADLAEAVQRVKYRTHRYIRQQSNWFRRDDPRIRWFDPAQMDSATEFAAEWIG